MKLTQLIKHEYLQLLLTAFILLVITVFFSAQPIHRSTVISCAAILWVVGLGFLPHYLKNKQFDKNEMILYALGALVFSICLLSWLTSPYFDGKFKTIEPDSRFLLFPLTVIAIRYSGLTFKHLAIALSCGAIAYVYVTYTSYSAGRVRGDENAVTFGNGAMLLVVVSSCLAFFEKDRLLKILLALAALGYFYASFRSGTRGSFVAFAPLSILFFYFMTNKMRVIMITLLLVGGIGISQTPLGDRLATSVGHSIDFFQKAEIRNSTGIRLHMWEAALCLNQEAPWLGLGPHQYKNGILDEDSTCDVKIVTVQAHSFYFNALATVGFLGLAAMLAFFFFLGKYSWSLPLISKVTIPAALITFLSYSITVDLLFHRYMADKHLTLLAILLGITLSQRKNKQANAA